MMNTADAAKVKRNVQFLFVLGFFLCLITSVGGGLMLVAGNPHPELTQPIWKVGQTMMFVGLCNLFVYVCLFLQMRRLMCKDGE